MSSEQAVSVVGSVTVVDRISLKLRWLAIASGVAALAMMIPLGVQMLRKGSSDATETSDTTAEVTPPVTDEKADPKPEPQAEIPKSEPTKVVSPTTEPAATEPAATDPATADPPVTEPPKTDPPATDPPKTEPAKPKPKPAATIGVAFVVKNKFDGSIKVGNKVAQTKYQGALLELRPGTYDVSLQPAGSTTWTPCGKLVITDIRPLGQRVDVWLSPPKVEKTGTYEVKGAPAK